MITKPTVTVLLMIMSAAMILGSPTPSAARTQTQSTLPLLSDLAYYQLKNTIHHLISTHSITIPTGYTHNFNEISLRFADTELTTDYQWTDTNTISITPRLPYFAIEHTIVARNHNQRVWQLNSAPPLSNPHLSTLRLIQPFKSFRGYLVFADAYPRTTIDFSEPYTKENAVVMRGINHQLNTHFIYFAEGLAPTQSFSPQRQALQVHHHQLKLFYSATGHRGHMVELNDILSSPQAFHGNETTKLHPCFFHKSAGHKLILTQPHPELITIKTQKTSCPQPPTSYLEHLWHTQPPSPTQPITITLSPPLQKILQHAAIHSFALSSPASLTSPHFTALFIKTSAPHSFTQKHIAADLVIILDKDHHIDGAFTISTHYFSPRHNVSFLPTPQAYLNHLAPSADDR